MLALTVIVGVVGLVLVVLGLLGLLRPSGYHALMRSRRPIVGLRVISILELVVGVAAIVIAVILL